MINNLTNNFEKRLNDFDASKEIFSAFAEMNLLHCFTVTGFNPVEIINNCTKAQIEKLITAITGEKWEYNTIEFFAIFNMFLLFFSTQMAKFPGLLEVSAEITASHRAHNQAQADTPLGQHS